MHYMVVLEVSKTILHFIYQIENLTRSLIFLIFFFNCVKSSAIFSPMSMLWKSRKVINKIKKNSESIHLQNHSASWKPLPAYPELESQLWAPEFSSDFPPYVSWYKRNIYIGLVLTWQFLWWWRWKQGLEGCRRCRQSYKSSCLQWKSLWRKGKNIL